MNLLAGEEFWICIESFSHSALMKSSELSKIHATEAMLHD